MAKMTKAEKAAEEVWNARAEQRERDHQLFMSEVANVYEGVRDRPVPSVSTYQTGFWTTFTRD